MILTRVGLSLDAAAGITRVAVVAFKVCLAGHPQFSEMPQLCFIVDAAALKRHPMGPLLQHFFPPIVLP